MGGGRGKVAAPCEEKGFPREAVVRVGDETLEQQQPTAALVAGDERGKSYVRGRGGVKMTVKCNV